MKNVKDPKTLAKAIKLYQDDGWSLQQIGDHFGTSRQNIHQWLMKAGVTLRSTGRRKKQLDREKLVKLYEEKKLNLGETAKKFKTNSALVVRELKRHSVEVRPKNYALRKMPEIFDLKTGETIIVPLPQTSKPAVTLHRKAHKLKIKISVRRLDENRMSVTRLK